MFEKNIEYWDFKDPALASYLQTFLSKSVSPHLQYMVPMIMVQYVQSQRGAQLVVEKALSDELMETDIVDFTAEDLIIPFPSVEVYFEDPDWPTILFYCKDEEFKTRAGKFLDADYVIPDTTHFGFDYYLKEGTGYTCQMNKELLNKWLKGEDLPDYPNMMPTDRVEKIRQREFFLMLAKLFTYISLPQYKPMPVSRNQLHHGGKAGVRNRPKRPCYRVILPPVKVKDRVRHDSVSTGKEIHPHRRRGHMRKLTSERYIQKKGQIIFIRPSLIHGGSLIDHLYIARKRTLNEPDTEPASPVP